MTCAMLYPMVMVMAIYGQVPETPGSAAELPLLTPGRTLMQNSLWFENDLKVRFDYTKRVVIADIKGPATITMISLRFPFPARTTQSRFAAEDLLGWREGTQRRLSFGRFLLRSGRREDEVNTAWVNKRQGWNAYFPMPSASLRAIGIGL